MYSEPEPEAHAIEATLILKVHASASLDCLLTNCLKVVNKPSSREATYLSLILTIRVTRRQNATKQEYDKNAAYSAADSTGFARYDTLDVRPGHQMGAARKIASCDEQFENRDRQPTGESLRTIRSSCFSRVRHLRRCTPTSTTTSGLLRRASKHTTSAPLTAITG